MRLTEELKECTRASHQATEKRMIEALKRLRSKEDYIRLLYWLYGFYSPLEESIGRHDIRHALPLFIGARRSDSLLRDIMDSGFPLRHHDECDRLPVIDSLPRALGALYVLEGSALGGRIIADIIRRQIGLSESLSFFDGDGNGDDEDAGTKARWQSLKNYLDQSCLDQDRQEILTAAEATFITFKNWIDKNELQPQL